MSRFFCVISIIIFYSCTQEKNVLGDWKAHDSSGSYAEFAIYDNFIQIYSDMAGQMPSWDYEIVGDSLNTSSLNYKIDWIKKDSLVLRNEKFTIQLKRINSGVCLSEVEGQPETYQPYIDSFYKRRSGQ